MLFLDFLLDNQNFIMYKSRLIAMLLLLSTNLLGQDYYGFLPPVNFENGVGLRSNMCVANPSTDIPWDRTKSFEDQVNEAIDSENRIFGTSFRNYVHPNYDASDPLDISAKVLAELRSVYQMPEIDIEYDESLMDLATDHSCAMDLDNTFCHSCPSDGSFNSRVNNRIGDRCFRSISENIAWITLTDVEASILRVLYLMMYADVACCDNGHRDNFLNCNYDGNSKIGFGIVRGDLQSSSGAFLDAWIMTWDYLTYWSYPDCGDCNCGVSIGTPLCDATAGIVLPIELNAFEATQLSCDEIRISWSTLTELNNDLFTIERSIDNEDWDLVQVVNAAGNSSSQLAYEYTDNISDLQSSRVYYRLIQTDYNGDSTTSDAIQLDVDCTDQEIVMHPNPASTYIDIISSDPLASVKIYSITGNLVLEKMTANQERLNISGLQAGIYLVTMETDKRKMEVKRLVKE